MKRDIILNNINQAINVLDRMNEIMDKLPALFPIEKRREYKEKIKKYKDKLKNYKFKIENNIMEVAFAGEEKAGKSTFVNAFIENNFLPSARKRATYVSTQVQYSPKNYMEVSFYTPEEFNKEVLQKFLEAIDFPDYDKHTLDTLSSETIKNFKNQLELKNKNLPSEVISVINDLIEIFEGKEKLEEYLTGETKQISLEGEDYKKFIVDPHISRAVKEVKIFTNKLEKLKNVIIYDLPGFNSPVFIHSKFTVDKIKKADAVVFVREADKPSLRGPEISILSKTREEDGTELKEKLFVFSNKVDSYFEEKEEIEENKKELINELKKYNLFVSEDRIFYGSALAHLQKLGIEKKTFAWEKIKKLGISTGIDEIKKALIKYNETERLKVLERRINVFLDEIKEFLTEIKKSLEGKVKDTDLLFFSLEAFIDVKNFAVNYILKKLYEYQNKLKEDLSQYPISKQIAEKVNNMDFDVDEEIKEDIKKKIQSTVVTSTILPEKYNMEVREILKRKIMEDYNFLIGEVINSYIKDFENNIFNIILEGLKPSEKKLNEVKENISKFLKKHLSEFESTGTNIKAIANRFSGDIIDLLSIPLTSIDRESKFKDMESEIYSLYPFTDEFDPNIPPKNTSFISLLLTQENPYNYDKLLEKIKNTMNLNEEDKKFEKIKNLINDLKKKRKYNVMFLLGQLSNISTPLRLIKMLEELLEGEDIFSDQDYISTLRKNLKEPKTYEEVDEEIKKDMAILKDILSKTVVRAINAEKSFVVYATKYITKLESLIRDKIFEEFIKNNLEYIKFEEFSQRKKLQAEANIINGILTDIDNLINSL